MIGAMAIVAAGIFAVGDVRIFLDRLLDDPEFSKPPGMGSTEYSIAALA